MKETLAIVGAGAAGLAAGIAALRQCRAQNRFLRVVVLERQDRAGRKLLATGNGRCNLTNMEAASHCYTSRAPEVLDAVLSLVPPTRVLRFFEDAGLLCAIKEEGRVYPQSNQASAVLDVLRTEFSRLGGEIQCSMCITAVHPTANGFSVQNAKGEVLCASRVIVCTGGLAAPQFGCDGTGYALLDALGHRREAAYPCLSPLKCDYAYGNSLKGVRAFCATSLLQNGTLVETQQGELLFTEYGVSGIPAMQLSRHTRHGGKSLRLSIDFLPSLSPAAIDSYLRRRALVQGDALLDTLLQGCLHKKLGPVLLREVGLSTKHPCNTLTTEKRQQLVACMKGWTLPVTEALSWSAAQVTGGGVLLPEICPSTMESLRCAGVYLCGEVLDAVGLCGGFNLHWAWATGILAGIAAAGGSNGFAYDQVDMPIPVAALGAKPSAARPKPASMKQQRLSYHNGRSKKK